MRRLTCVGQDRKDLLPCFVDECADAFCRGSLGGSVDNRIAPIHWWSSAALDVDIGSPSDAKAAPDQPLAVAGDQGPDLVVDFGYRVHSSIRIDHNPMNRSGV